MTTHEIALQLMKEEGRIERNTFFVTSLIQSTNFTDEKIVAIAGVSPEFVKETKKKLYGITHTLSKTEEIAIEIMKRDGIDIKKSFEQKAAFMALMEKTAQSSGLRQDFR